MVSPCLILHEVFMRYMLEYTRSFVWLRLFLTPFMFLFILTHTAVHGAMAGFTGFSVGLCNNRMVFLPIPELVATSPRSMNPRGRTWERILAITRQPNTVPDRE
jgi:hypothetical protein